MSDPALARRIAAALASLDSLDQQRLVTLRENALRFGSEAGELVSRIDERLAAFKADGGISVHRLEFARQMLRMVERAPILNGSGAATCSRERRRNTPPTPTSSGCRATPPGRFPSPRRWRRCCRSFRAWSGKSGAMDSRIASTGGAVLSRAPPVVTPPLTPP